MCNTAITVHLKHFFIFFVSSGWAQLSYLKIHTGVKSMYELPCVNCNSWKLMSRCMMLSSVKPDFGNAEFSICVFNIGKHLLQYFLYVWTLKDFHHLAVKRLYPLWFHEPLQEIFSACSNSSWSSWITILLSSSILSTCITVPLPIPSFWSAAQLTTSCTV